MFDQNENSELLIDIYKKPSELERQKLLDGSTVSLVIFGPNVTFSHVVSSLSCSRSYAPPIELQHASLVNQDRMLMLEGGCSFDEYEKWLGEFLIQTLHLSANFI